MKKLISILTILTISMMFISCQSDSINPVENNNSDITLNKVNPIVANVTGSGHFYFNGNENYWRTFSFTAKLYEDGTVKGNYTRTHHFHDESQHAKGIITCLLVEGNEAWIAGEDTQGSNYDPEFSGTIFHAVDNGEGKTDLVDQISAQWVNITPVQAIEYCAIKYTPDLNEVIAGNIQVH